MVDFDASQTDDEQEHWRRRGDEAMARLEAGWRSGLLDQDLEYLRRRALALEALSIQVDGPDFF
jgi:hypothetical protein